MKRIRRYLIRLSIALLAFILGFTVYLFAPPLRSTVKDVPHEPPIALVPSKENKGKRCEANTRYTYEKQGYSNEIVDEFCTDMQTSLLDAIENNDVEGLRLALAQGANPNSDGIATDDVFQNSETPLLAAAGNVEITRLLLDNGADINKEKICCGANLTPLNNAAFANQKETVKALLARDAKIFVDEDGSTAFDIAALQNNEDIAQLFDEAGKISWIQRAELRIAKLPFVNIKDIHKTFKALGEPFKPLGESVK